MTTPQTVPTTLGLSDPAPAPTHHRVDIGEMQNIHTPTPKVSTLDVGPSCQDVNMFLSLDSVITKETRP